MDIFRKENKKSKKTNTRKKLLLLVHSNLNPHYHWYIPIITRTSSSYHIKLNTLHFVISASSSFNKLSLSISPISRSSLQCLTLSNSQLLHALSTSLPLVSTLLSLPSPSANSLSPPPSSTPHSELPPLPLPIPPPPRRFFTLPTALPPSNQRSDPPG